MTPEIRRVIELRLAVSQAATKKYKGIADWQLYGRMYDTLQAWGAGRTKK